MHITGPTSVPANQSITVTAQDFGTAAFLGFSVAGLSKNGGFSANNVEKGAPVSYTEKMTSPGPERIDLTAMDAQGNVVGVASHSFTVTAATAGGTPRRRLGDDGPGNGGGYVLDVQAPSKVEVNSEWRYRVAGLKDMHSVLVELYDANGGLFRLFPRGRDVMEHAITPAALGKTKVIMVGRDGRMKSLITIVGEIEVAPVGSLNGPGSGGGYIEKAEFVPLIPIEPMGLAKPPFASEAPGGGFGGAMRASGTQSLEEVIQARTAAFLSKLGKK